MKKIVVVVLSVLIFGQSFGKEEKGNSGRFGSPVICYASGKSLKTFVGPPAHLKNASNRTANITVDYVGFSAEAQKAFQYAVDIWKNLIYSPVPIHIRAEWTALGSGVLGNCRPGDMVSNFEGTERWNYDYPIALAEKMAGKELNNPGDYEMLASFSSNLPYWYYGTDGNCPANRYDLASVVLHELGHGLGFFGNFYSSRGRGGYYNPASAYDRQVVNKSGNQLINTSLYANPSIALNSNLISGWLNFDTDLLNGELPRLYAPTTWKDGSSIYHLDEDTYRAGNVNSLMTPYTNAGEAIHDPGPDALGVLYDIGWKSVSVLHKKIKDIESVTGPILVNARILSDNGLDLNTVYLVYSPNKFVKRDSVRLVSSSAFDDYSASLPVNQNATYQYYFSMKDLSGRRYVYPSNEPEQALTFKIGPDNENPIVIYSPLPYMMETDPKTKIVATITDNLGIKTANLEYFLNGGLKKQIALKNDSNDIYSGELIFEPGTVKDGDVISYRVVATDASFSANVGRFPVSGYSTFRVEGFRNPVEVYANNFDSQPNDFISSDFTVTTPPGFSSAALNSPHPYQSPETDYGRLNFVAMLKYPVILKSGSRMSYDEIALVEPGDSGTVYGELNFFDYVIVEGSRDGGSTWLPLINGYDCRAQKSWLNLYNSSISGQNSTATPTKDLFVNNDFGMLSSGSFATGDTILVRFRLYSDPYANGWGWIIDNLKIYNDGTSLAASILSPGEVLLYPNPAKDQINLDIETRSNFRNLTLKVYNSSGSLVLNRMYAVDSNISRTAVDVQSLKPGLYLFVVGPENGVSLTRKVLIN